MIGLMDCNNFFVSCERLFRPDLRKKPVMVLSSNDGCVVSRSQEVKDLGIPMGVPYFEVKDICKKHDISVFSSNFTLYRDVSSRIMEALKDEFETIQIYSIDEAFMEIPPETTVEEMYAIRTRIIQKTGIPVSFGIAPTKTIAKIANGEAKKGSGVHWLTTETAEALYENVSCGSVWGIGTRISTRLYDLEVRTVADLMKKGRSFARQEFGVHGERLFLELSGTRTDAETSEDEVQGSIMSTRSFPRKISEKHILLSALGYHVAHIGEKLREEGLMAGRVQILCAPSRFDSFHSSRKRGDRVLEMPTCDTSVLLKIAGELLEELYDPTVPYKKAGVVVSDLVPAAYVSPSLFRGDLERESDTLYSTVDALNDRFGRGTVKPASTLSDVWVSRSQARSPEYTTRWSDICKVKAV